MKLRFVNKVQESDDVWSFFFEPAEPLDWIAGQSIRLELPRKSWGYEEQRFTIASAPREGHVRITTRLSDSEFKQTLSRLESGAFIDGHNIEGDFIWDSLDRPKLFLAAGIGITPFRSLLAEHAAAKNVKLLYQSKDKLPVFGKELADRLGKGLRVTSQRLSLDTIADFCPDWKERVVYISGPEQMVRDISRSLLGAGLSPKWLITDLFTGLDKVS